MKNIKQKITAASLALVGVMGCTTGVYAAENYGITYSGGEPLGADNVTIDSDLIDELTPLVKVSNNDATITASDSWQEGYAKDGEYCTYIKYFRLSNSETVGPASGLTATLSNSQYATDIQITNASIDNAVDGKTYIVGLMPTRGYLGAGWELYNDDQCSDGQKDETISHLKHTDGARLFIKTKLKVRHADAKTPIIAKELYFGLVDIDASQSYRVLNTDNKLTKDNMFAKSAEGLQSSDPSVTFRNMFVTSNGSIYSEYDPSSNAADSALGLPATANIYVQLTEDTQENGLDMVFGFAGSAASGLEYYAKQYEVTYKSDDNGEITGIKDEEVIGGENPSGTAESAKEGFILTNWIANEDVTLKDGTIIEAGGPISTEQIKLVVVDRDITFTAIHADESTIAVPDTGAFTGTLNAATIASVSIVGVLALALTVRALPRLTHKKVKFE